MAFSGHKSVPLVQLSNAVICVVVVFLLKRRGLSLQDDRDLLLIGLSGQGSKGSSSCADSYLFSGEVCQLDFVWLVPRA